MTPSPYVIPGIEITKQVIKELILKRFPNVEPEKLNTPIRKREYVMCRAFLMAFLRMTTNESTTKIGAPFNRDHCTVLHNFSMIICLYETDKETKRTMDYLLNVCLVDPTRFEKFKMDSQRLKVRN